MKYEVSLYDRQNLPLYDIAISWGLKTQDIKAILPITRSWDFQYTDSQERHTLTIAFCKDLSVREFARALAILLHAFRLDIDTLGQHGASEAIIHLYPRR